MIVAVSVLEGRIAPVFDVSRHAVLLDVRGGSVASRRPVAFDSDDPARKTRQLTEWDVHTLICGAISGLVESWLAASGVRTIPFVAGGEDEVIGAFLAGSLPAPGLSMPGCCRRRRGRGVLPPGAALFRERRWTMPQGDGTGPQGKGPGTGRRLGRCWGQGGGPGPVPGKPGQTPGGPGRGMGRGFGRGGGRGFGRGGGGGRGGGFAP